MSRVSLTTVIVAHDSLAQLSRTLPALDSELGVDDELIIVDNASRDGLAERVGQLAPRARLLRLERNLGFAGGANAGAAAARADLLVLLNPDARVAHGWGEAIRAPWARGADAWMGLVTLDDEHSINTSGGVVHFTGFGWAGQVGEPIADAPADGAEVGFLSGACLAIPRATWRAVGGFSEHFFMYCEDVDLSLRLRLRGCNLTLAPDARVAHDYEFVKGDLKWRMLERNRWATVLRTYPAPLLAAIAPALVAAELAVWGVAVRGGWARMKALATTDVLRSLPRLLAERRAIQTTSRISARAFADHLTAALDSPYLGTAGRQPLIAASLALYWRGVLALLGSSR